MMHPAHDLVLFDLDGTLSDPLVGIGRSINFALAHYGYAELPLSEIGAYVGPPLDQSFAKITGADSPAMLDALVAKYRERYGDVGYAENVLYAGIEDALRAIDQAGIPMGLCTSKRADFAERILGMFGLRAYFRFVSGGEIGIAKSQQVRALLDRGDVSASSVIVGDRGVDVIAAHRNGLSAAGVLWGYGSRDELEAEAPRYLFSRPAELVRLAGADESAL